MPMAVPKGSHKKGQHGHLRIGGFSCELIVEFQLGNSCFPRPDHMPTWSLNCFGRLASLSPMELQKKKGFLKAERGWRKKEIVCQECIVLGKVNLLRRTERVYQ